MKTNQRGATPILVLAAIIGVVVLFSLYPKSNTFAQTTNTITLNPAVKFQTIKGWEAVNQAGQIDSSKFAQYKDYLFDQAVNDLGINRLRLEIKPNSANNAFDLNAFDARMDDTVIPIKQKVEARGEKLWLNVTYVHKSAANTLTNAGTYAQQVLNTYQHLQSKYGLIPDSWEAALEPGVFQYPLFNLANSIVATGDLLTANGFPVYMVAPSSECGPGTAIQAWQQMLPVNSRLASSGYVKEFAYHRYCLPSGNELQTIAGYRQTYNLETAMLEHGAADYNELHQDLKDAQVSSWEQFALAYPTVDDGYQYYVINNSGTTPQTQVTMAWRTKYLRQYFKFIRPQAQRISSTTSNAEFDPLAFINKDGKYVVVVKATAAATLSINGLAGGTYGIKYTTNAEYDKDLADQDITAGQGLTTNIPTAGVITIYAKTIASTSPAPSASPAKIGDIDNDGDIDIFDYNQILTDFGKTGTNLIADIEKSGTSLNKVDIFDYNLLLTNFGK